MFSVLHGPDAATYKATLPSRHSGELTGRLQAAWVYDKWLGAMKIYRANSYCRMRSGSLNRQVKPIKPVFGATSEQEG